MKLFKESFVTLQLFALFFFVYSGSAGLYSQVIEIQVVGFDPLWNIPYVLWCLSYVVGGLYFVFNVKKLIPRFRLGVIRVLAICFALETLNAIAWLVTGVQDPSLFDPELLNDPNALLYVYGGTLAAWLFNALLYLVMYHAINVVSGHSKGKPPVWMTAGGWAIVALAVGSTVVFAFLSQ
jgi:hypothetical protein